MHEIENLSEELESVVVELAPLLAVGESIRQSSTPEQGQRRAELAEWLNRLSNPQEIALLALATAEAFIEAGKQLEAICNGLEALEAHNESERDELLRQFESLLKLSVAKTWRKALSANARRGAMKVLSNNSKQAAKQAAKRRVHKLWEEWRAGDHQFKGKAAFARFALSKEKELESSKVIEGWVRDWDGEKNAARISPVS